MWKIGVRFVVAMGLLCSFGMAPAQGMLSEHIIQHEDASRRYIQYLPGSLPPGPRAAVLILHSEQQSAQQVASFAQPWGQWRSIADREGLVLLYPEAVNGEWNDCQAAPENSTVNDVGFLEEVITDVAGRVPLDDRRIYAVGASNGGRMSYRLAVQRSARYAGHLAALALTPRDSIAGCAQRPANPVNLMVQLGSLDERVPFTGGARFVSFAETRDFWLHVNRCTTGPTVRLYPDLNSGDNSRIREYAYACPSSQFLTLVAEGAGHALPSLAYPTSGLQNRDIELAEEAWAVFRQVQRVENRIAHADFEFENQPPFQIASVSAEIYDPSRNYREIGARIFAPLHATGERKLVLISHGGLGTNPANPGVELTNFTHIAEPIARMGMVAIVVGHRSSGSLSQHRLDRPRDISFVIDQIESRGLLPPKGFQGRINTSRVGHTGHSAGAYTSMAVGGAIYPYGQFRDVRIAAIAPISPQGVGEEFLAFDNGPDDNTWRSIDIPTMILLGRDELDLSGTGNFIETGWRLRAFSRLTAARDRFQLIIDEQDHIEMGGNPAQGTPIVRNFIGENLAAFFSVYLDDQPGICGLGRRFLPAGIPVSRETRLAVDGRLFGCPD